MNPYLESFDGDIVKRCVWLIIMAIQAYDMSDSHLNSTGIINLTSTMNKLNFEYIRAVIHIYIHNVLRILVKM